MRGERVNVYLYNFEHHQDLAVCVFLTLDVRVCVHLVCKQTHPTAGTVSKLHGPTD